VLERITTLKTRAPVRTVTGSPDGRWLVVTHGEPHATTAEVYRRVDTGLERVCEPPPAATMFVLDDGAAIGLHGDYNEIEIVRHGADGVHQATFIARRGVALAGFAYGLEADGQHATVSAVDRDDGHGWSHPAYEPRCARIDLRSGAAGPGELGAHLLRGPGVATRSPDAGGDAAALKARLAALPSRTEWPLRVGPSRLLTTSRVIDIAGGETVLAAGALFDLSADERLAVGSDQGRFALHDLHRRAVVEQLDPKYQVRCAAFLTAREIVVGTAEGRILLLGLAG
jgi:hypothetical protein